MIKPTRRGFITGLISLAVTAPAIVRISSLMPIKNMFIGNEPLINFEGEDFIFTARNTLYPSFKMELLEMSADNIRMFMLGDIDR